MQIDRNDLALAVAAKNAAVASAKARTIQTAADEGRYRTLLDAGVATRQSYDQVKAAADTARAELRQAEAEAQVANNEGGYSVLTADADGVVTDTLAEPGQVCKYACSFTSNSAPAAAATAVVRSHLFPVLGANDGSGQSMSSERWMLRGLRHRENTQSMRTSPRGPAFQSSTMSPTKSLSQCQSDFLGIDLQPSANNSKKRLDREAKAVKQSGMKLHRAAALALLGWYLMVPPIELSPNGERIFNFYAPLSQWYRWDFYDSARECWDVDHDLFVRSQSILRIDPFDDAANAYLEAQCIATDDPRLEN
jgi:hypothetical protein